MAAVPFLISTFSFTHLKPSFLPINEEVYNTEKIGSKSSVSIIDLILIETSICNGFVGFKFRKNIF